MGHSRKTDDDDALLFVTDKRPLLVGELAGAMTGGATSLERRQAALYKEADAWDDVDHFESDVRVEHIAFTNKNSAEPILFSFYQLLANILVVVICLSLPSF